MRSVYDDRVGELRLTYISLEQTVEIALSIDKKVVNTAALSDAERFSEIPYIMEDASNANDSPRSSISGAKVLHSWTPSKRCIGSAILLN